MSDRPIIFSGPMVQAILAGRKTQTRRIAKINAIMGNRVAVTSPDERLIELEPGEFRRGLFHCDSTGALTGAYRLPAATGDRLWVRETWAAGACAEGLSPTCLHQGFWRRDNGGLWYRADEAEPAHPITPRGRWRPSIHMPRWASRLTLLVTDVRVQRLQEISEGDAIAEGVVPRWPDGVEIRHDGSGGVCREAFAHLWNILHGPDAWAENPWVAAITFSVERRNIDARTAP